VFASAPPEPGPIVRVLPDPNPDPIYEEEDRSRREQYERQVADARSTLELIERALLRINTLERFLPRRA
jgi:hypothetical protein